MSIDDVEDRVRDLAPSLGQLGAVIKFCLKDGGILSVNATCEHVEVSREDCPADTTVTISSGDLMKLMDGKLDPMVAFAMGKIKVDGSKGLAMKLTKLLG